MPASCCMACPLFEAEPLEVGHCIPMVAAMHAPGRADEPSVSGAQCCCGFSPGVGGEQTADVDDCSACRPQTLWANRSFDLARPPTDPAPGAPVAPRTWEHRPVVPLRCRNCGWRRRAAPDGGRLDPHRFLPPAPGSWPHCCAPRPGC